MQIAIECMRHIKQPSNMIINSYLPGPLAPLPSRSTPRWRTTIELLMYGQISKEKTICVNFVTVSVQMLVLAKIVISFFLFYLRNDFERHTSVNHYNQPVSHFPLRPWITKDYCDIILYRAYLHMLSIVL